MLPTSSNASASSSGASSSKSALNREKNYIGQLYEHNAVLVEQLQRELATTVDALHREAPYDGGEGSHFTHQARNNVNLNQFQNQHEGPHYIPNHLNQSQHSFSQEGLVYDLLRNSQETAARLKIELDNARVEKEVCHQELSQIKLQNKRLLDDQEQLTYAKRDLEGKMQFRMNQVLELEQERSKNSLKETELTERLSILERQNNALRSDLVASNTELRVAMARNTSLEQRLKDQRTEGEANTIPMQIYLQLQEELERQKTQSVAQAAALQTQLSEVKRRYGELSDKRIKDLHHAASVPASNPSAASRSVPIGRSAPMSGTSTPPRREYNPPAPTPASIIRAASMQSAAGAIAAAAALAGVPSALPIDHHHYAPASSSSTPPIPDNPMKPMEAFSGSPIGTTLRSTLPIPPPLRIPTPPSNRYAMSSNKEVLSSSDDEDQQDSLASTIVKPSTGKTIADPRSPSSATIGAANKAAPTVTISRTTPPGARAVTKPLLAASSGPTQARRSSTLAATGTATKGPSASVRTSPAASGTTGADKKPSTASAPTASRRSSIATNSPSSVGSAAPKKMMSPPVTKPAAKPPIERRKSLA